MTADPTPAPAGTVQLTLNGERRTAAPEQGAAVQTLEGLDAEGTLTPRQSAFWANNAFPCGFCLSGMLFAAEDLLERLPSPTRGEIREAISGTLCRCTGPPEQPSTPTDPGDPP
ncbi:MAG: 4-hydroxybenzoyl-CoA reductase subunit gamma [Modestobacter sp.]|jgi:aerobic-type carbon monoxide dehydrogenase small subunit (CoxS/CutS family)|nr:4-hydroxybenzoyl-CoA reductase subunit gamma [Modestobacter sp.]